MRRRFTAVSAAVLSALPLFLAAGCGGPDVQVSVKGAPGQRPEVRIPKGTPKDGFASKVLAKGKGRGARKGDLVVADYVGYRWSKDGSKLLASSYLTGQPEAFPTWEVVPGLAKAFEGARPGARVVAKIPPKQGYGDAGDQGRQIGPDDTLVYVLDVRGVFTPSAMAHGTSKPLSDPALPQVGDGGAGQAPSITVPKRPAPKALGTRTLVQGDGPQVRKGQLLALQYKGVFWRNGKEFDSSWTAGHPHAVTIGTGQVIKGWDQALLGQRVGSRLLLVVPPALAYKPLGGLPQAGIRADDSLVFVVDILGAF
ncbi:FKBP-type peptidyl-prolyl cis-trans isomerase [Actinomadura logoneensis]|uniref:Peptidyl-prolyl cis-trans isomerase n=1 Tax=Actinomadura logoneensis TaxID=2293572 RepID=A0A372JMT5_9ACTN|nr:FKBP-type peptidyl-prolyl cis-trans isomerase [Actinomadura logoneensis]RFU41317.1 FKBP-type peptidyl-prolyl cis-trans isomerase [Actinomadura logoneensis]